MLSQFLNIVNSSNVDIEGDNIFLKNYIVNDLECLQQLDIKQCVNSFHRNDNTILYEDIKRGDTIDIDLSLLYLTTIGYYENFATFIRKNQYCSPVEPYFIRDIGCYNNDNNIIINAYLSVLSLIEVIKMNAKHCYSELNIDFSLIFREDKALSLRFEFDDTIIKQINETDVEILKTISSILTESDSDKKFLFINELITFLSPVDEDERFVYLLSNAEIFLNKANNAYQYYIRNFSYNKLKAELDNAALDYSRKIQSVINESQTKLIAIPTAFVLAVASMDFTEIYSTKNIALIISLFIFSFLIDIFLRNQKSALKFIAHNISTYKASFESNNGIVEQAFTIVDKEFKKQKNRLILIRCVTWGLPIILSIVAIIFLYHQFPEIQLLNNES